jgi:NDP-sugar pyrophosphorylase family protein
MIAIIQAGGKGTRLKAVTGDLPKPLVLLADRPVIFRIIDSLRASGVVDGVIVLAGYAGDLLSEVLNKEFGSFVTTVIESKPLGSGGCLRLAFPFLKNRSCLLISGDLFLDFSFKKLIKYHSDTGADVTLTVHGNNHPLDADLIEPDAEFKFLKQIHLRPHPADFKFFNIVNAAITVLNPEFFNFFPDGEFLSFESDVLLPFSRHKKIALYLTSEYIQDIGTPERLQIAERYLADKEAGFFDPTVLIVELSDILKCPDGQLRETMDNLIAAQNKGAIIAISNLENKPAIEIKKLESTFAGRGIKVSWRQVAGIDNRPALISKISNDISVPASSIKMYAAKN